MKKILFRKLIILSFVGLLLLAAGLFIIYFAGITKEKILVILRIIFGSILIVFVLYLGIFIYSKIFKTPLNRRLSVVIFLSILLIIIFNIFSMLNIFSEFKPKIKKEVIQRINYHLSNKIGDVYKLLRGEIEYSDLLNTVKPIFSASKEVAYLKIYRGSKANFYYGAVSRNKVKYISRKNEKILDHFQIHDDLQGKARRTKTKIYKLAISSTSNTEEVETPLLFKFDVKKFFKDEEKRYIEATNQITSWIVQFKRERETNRNKKMKMVFQPLLYEPAGALVESLMTVTNTYNAKINFILTNIARKGNNAYKMRINLLAIKKDFKKLHIRAFSKKRVRLKKYNTIWQTINLKSVRRDVLDILSRISFVNSKLMPWVDEFHESEIMMQENSSTKKLAVLKMIDIIKFYKAIRKPGRKTYGVIEVGINNNEIMSNINPIIISGMLSSGIFIIISVCIALLISRSISRPITKISDETNRIKEFDLSGDLNIKSSIFEIQLISKSLTAMKNGLLAFKKYVPADLVRQLIQTGQEAKLGGKKKELSIFFSDIAGFTSISEIMPAEDLMMHLSKYLNELSQIIQNQRGTIDKYMGDAIMAFWGAPVEDENHAINACQAALLCQAKLRELNTLWKKNGLPLFPTRIGINTGEIIVGNLGSSERLNYTIIGDNVNLASRLEGVNKLYGTQIIVNQTTYEKAKSEFIFRPVDIVAVKGKNESIKIFELISKKDSPEVAKYKNFSEEFTRAFGAYLNQEWKSALMIFQKLAVEYPTDRVVEIYIKRCKHFENNPPGPNWDGVVRLNIK